MAAVAPKARYPRDAAMTGWAGYVVAFRPMSGQITAQIDWGPGPFGPGRRRLFDFHRFISTGRVAFSRT
jgi:hypothetical protein